MALHFPVRALKLKAIFRSRFAPRLALSVPFAPYLDPMPHRKALPHVNAAAHAKVMARLRSATPEERVQSLIRAGILTKSGKFTAPYREF